MNKSIILEKYEYNLQHEALHPFKDDFSIVFECVKKKTENIKYASCRLKDNFELAMLVAEKCPSFLSYMSVRLQSHIDVLKKAYEFLEEKDLLTDEVKFSYEISKAEATRRLSLITISMY